MPYADPAKYREYQKSYRLKHLARLRKAASDRQRANPEQAAERKRRWYAKNRNLALARSAARAVAMPGVVKGYKRKYYAANVDAVKARAKAWAAANPDVRRAVVAAHEGKRRTARFGDQAAVRRFYRQVKTATRMTCFWCARPVAKGSRHVDHVIPISKGGKHCVTNLVGSCAKCNMKKHDQMPEAFSPQLLLNLTA